ncbi:MAG: acyltransferase [Bacteroidota bacterium]
MNNKHIIKAEFFNTGVDPSVRNVGLDLIRGLCVILIVLAHTNNILKSYIPILYRTLFPFVEMSQNVFFALSGYLIGNQILRMTREPGFGKKELFSFYKKRWIRTLPFYYMFLIVNLILFHFVYLPYGPEFLKFDFKPFPYFVFIQNLFSRHPNFFPEIWSMPIEEWSYLLLPLPFLILGNIFRKGNVFGRRLFYFVILILLVQAARMIHINFNHPETDWELRKIVIYRLDALVYGCILALMAQSERIRDYVAARRNRLLALGLLMLAISLFFNRLLTKETYNTIFFLYQPLACTLILPYFIYSSFNLNAMSKILTHLSLTSYAILLSHLYCIQFLFITFCKVNSLGSALLTTFVYLLALVLFSTIFYNLVERPILIMRKK